MALLVANSYAQTELRSGTVQQLMNQLTVPSLMGETVNQLADLGAVEAVPTLKAAFSKIEAKPSSSNFPTDDLVLKSMIASALTRLGETTPEYWDFISLQAGFVADSHAPFPLKVDAQGAIVKGELSEEFLAWAATEKLPAEAAAANEFYGMPLRIIPVAISGDPRGLPILRQALKSKNYVVQQNAAAGLALLQDKDSIPAIIDACKGSQYSEVIARALVFFDDPRAQEAAEQYVRNQALLSWLRQQKATYGPRGLFR